MSDGLVTSVRSNASLVAMEFSAAAREMRDVATVRALNKVADQVVVTGSREMRAAGYNLKISTIKKGLRIARASPGALKATVIASGRPIPLVQFGARQTSKGVTVNVLKGRKLIAGAFIATMPSGHKGVYVREATTVHKKMRSGSKASWHALPIRELFGPSVPDGLSNKFVQDRLQQFINEKFPEILKHESQWLSRKLGRR